MKRILLLLLMMAGMANATTVAIVVEDNTSRSTIGVDTLLGDFLTTTLGYTVHYRDVDTTHNAAYWNGAGYAAIVVVGSEKALPSPQSEVDNIAASNIPFMTIGNSSWDEINLGTAAVTLAEGTGYVVNIGSSHWITRTVQDTVVLWTVEGTGTYSISIPDTLHDVDVLLLDKDSRADTSSAIMAACEAGETIINTGDGVNVANQRRVFFGLFQYQSSAMDSCQFYTLFGRGVAWLSGDTLNDGLMSGFCFSGWHELTGSYVVENSSGNDSIESYGNWPAMYTGLDWEEKTFYIKPMPLAVQRKLGSIYRSATLGSLNISLRLRAKEWDLTAWENNTPPATYSSTIALCPILRMWRSQNSTYAYFSSTFPYACWTYRYGEDVGGTFTPYTWNGGGASTAQTDYDTTRIDSLMITQADALGTTYYLDLDTVVTESRLLDSSLFQGWVARTPSATYTGPGVEVAFHSVFNGLSSRPVVRGQLSTWSTTVPEPTIAIQYLDSAVTCDSIVFTGIVGQTIAPQYVTISNSAGGALECLSITDDGGWLTLVESGSNTPITLTLAVTGQAAGYTYATVTVVCADAGNTPQTLKVVRNLTAAGARTAGGAVIIK